MLEVTPFFAVPFGTCRYERAAVLNGPLRERLLSWAREGASQANPRPLTQRNDAVFESHFGLFRSSDPHVTELREFCLSQVVALVSRLNGYDEHEQRRLELSCDSWFHVTRRSGYFGLHNHPNASWSGVYCVDPGDPEPADRSSGLLSFVNPALPAAMHVDAGNGRISGPFSTHVRQFRLEAGQLVLFPSWVLHEVTVYLGERERITVAFNCAVRLAAARS